MRFLSAVCGILVLLFAQPPGKLRAQTRPISDHPTVRAAKSGSFDGEAAASARYAGAGVLTIEDLIRRPAADRYDLVALRVEFKPDSSLFSTGVGTFGGDLYPGADPPRVDPLPHDAEYFAAHLEFLENYVRRVSDGKTVVETHLLPVVVAVSGPMADYAPIGPDAATDAELVKLARFVEEAWTLAGELDSFDMPAGLDPARTAFLIFHAGVGRDIELLGTTLDKTPEDLPSLYFDEGALTRLLGGFDVTVDGVPVTNTLVIPRTETRRGFDPIEDRAFLAELSINGLLAASFLSYLGVPDLFDTETGESAIGPFGVMDGLGIFAFGGLLPPEPSAWTKLYLGWADVRFADPSAVDENVFLPHAGSETGNAAFLAPIAEDEYFLVENRNRDPEGDGLNLLVWKEGVYTEVNVEHGDPDFGGFSTAGFPGGVVVDADNLDFVLPGGLDDENRVLAGGALIWHVDERRLRDGLPANEVNVGERRAIDVEEADGGQDIGHPGAGFFGPSFELGSPYDFFYDGNPTVVITPTGNQVRLYENRFGPDTHPGSASNSGGSSFVEIADFSPPGSTMSFLHRLVPEHGVTPRPEAAFVFDFAETDDVRAKALFQMPGSGADFSAFAIEADGTARLVWSLKGQTAGTSDPILPARPVHHEGGVSVLAPDGFHTLAPDGSYVLAAPLPPGLALTNVTTAIAATTDGALLVGAEDEEGPMVLTANSGVVATTGLAEPLRSVAVADGTRAVFVYSDRAEVPSLERRWRFDSLSGEPLQAAFARSDDGLAGVVPDPGNRRLFLLLEDESIREVSLAEYAALGVDGPLSSYPVIADLDGDGLADVLFVVGTSLLAVNRDGAVVAGFPIHMREMTLTQPLVFRAVDGHAPVVLVASVDGRIDAYDTGTRSHSVPGFPLAVGAGMGGTPILRGADLFAMSERGAVARWHLDSDLEVLWGEAFGERNSSFYEIPEPIGGGAGGDAQTLLVRGETYNWPNPVRDGITWIRFTPSAPSDVRITIVDLAGSLVDQLDVAGAPGSVATEIAWRPGAGSGVYFARVTATDTSGRTESELIKIAVIR